jgi:hypothetical protein
LNEAKFERKKEDFFRLFSLSRRLPEEFLDRVLDLLVDEVGLVQVQLRFLQSIL